MGLASAGMPTVKPERTGCTDEIGGNTEVGRVAGNLVEEHQSGDGSLKANISVSAPISRFQSAPWISLTCPSSRAASMNSRRSLKGIVFQLNCALFTYPLPVVGERKGEGDAVNATFDYSSFKNVPVLWNVDRSHRGTSPRSRR